MNSYTFEASFNEIAARLKEMQQERPGSRGFIYAKIRGHDFPVNIAEAAPGGKIAKTIQRYRLRAYDIEA